MKAINILSAIIMATSGSALAVDFTALQTLKSSGPNSPLHVPKGYIEGNNTPLPVPAAPLEWAIFTGGKFSMGTNSDGGFNDARPIHEVDIKTFAMSKTDVTVEQYADCVNEGVCTEPASGENCNWGVPGRRRHPVNCVDWYQANQYAKFLGARLPTESEWEYAATNGGKNQKYPWGNAEATCARAVMDGNGGYGCGKNSTWPVCSKPAGNTAHGLCDMAGNVSQWVQDNYETSYAGAPSDGSSFETVGFPRAPRALRGGNFYKLSPGHLRADYRAFSLPDYQGDGIGFRLAISGR